MAHRETRAKGAGRPAFVSILDWLPSYDRSWFRFDVIAGLTLWGLLVPEAMAYAGIAGLPPQAGLYTLTASMLVYALFGTSRHLSVGATSATAALLASSVAATIAAVPGVDASDPAVYYAFASAFVLVVGFVYLAAYVARLGFITQFLSKPVMDGFVVGLAGFVAVGQLYKLFGVERPHGNTVEKLGQTLRSLPEANWATFAVGAAALALLFILPKLNPKIPAGLVVLFGAIGLSGALGLEGTYGIEVVGALPQGLPALGLPQVPLAAYGAMVIPALGVLLLSFSEGLGVAHEFAEKHGYEVRADPELKAIALSNLASGVVGGMITAGSMSGSAVNESAGARSQVANLVTWVATILTLLFLTPLFAPLPEAVLGALIIHAVWHIIASRKLLRLRQEAPVEVWFGVITLLGVLFVEVLQGMLIGLLASLLFVVYRTSRPHVASLGRISDVPGAYFDLGRHPEGVSVPQVLIVRPEAQLYYANAMTFSDRVKEMVAESEPAPRVVVADVSGQYGIDVTSAEMLASLVRTFRGRGVDVYFGGVLGPVRDNARDMGLIELVGEEHFLPTLERAVNEAERKATSG